jgi:hypothetical protein
MVFIDILEQIFDCLDAGTDLHIDMTVVLCTEKLVVWDRQSINYPTGPFCFLLLPQYSGHLAGDDIQGRNPPLGEFHSEIA